MDSMGKTRRREEKERWQGFGRDAASPRMTKQDFAQLRELGFGDAVILEIVQATALFAYYNRLAEGLGVDPEPGMAAS